jgi:hypothetical protein
MQYFYLSWLDRDDVKVARAPKGTLSFELAEKMRGKDELPFVLELDEDAILLDYLPNTIAWPLMSERLRRIISDVLTEGQEISWIKARVQYGQNEVLYWIPRFTKQIDVLDRSKTIFAGAKFVVKAHLSLSKVAKYNFFPLPDLAFTSRNIVSELIRTKIENAALTGINFEKVAAS